MDPALREQYPCQSLRGGAVAFLTTIALLAPAEAAYSEPPTTHEAALQLSPANDPVPLEQTTDKTLGHHRLFVVPLGDSITAGYGVPEGKDWVSQYAKLSGNKTDNLGASGACVVDPCLIPAPLEGRFGAEVLSQHPDVAVVEGGINDLQDGNTAHAVIEGFRKIIRQAARNGTPLILCTIHPFGRELPEAESKYEAGVKKINHFLRHSKLRGKKYEVADTARVLVDRSGQLKPEADHDGFHLTSKGYRMYARVVNGAVAELVELSRPVA